MGCDSAGVGGWHLQLRADPKVFHVGHFLIGYTDSFRMGQLLRFGEQPRFTFVDDRTGKKVQIVSSAIVVERIE